jgi:hypothetical protein
VFSLFRGPAVLRAFIQSSTAGAESVVELGAMFGDNFRFVASGVKHRIAVEIHEPYIERGRRQNPNAGYTWIQGDIRNIGEILGGRVHDVGLLLDVIEHVEKSEGEKLLRKCQRLFRKLLVFTPDGLTPQERDVFGMGADTWQRHRCGWSAEDLEAFGFHVWRAADYHRIEGKMYAALFATWEAEWTTPTPR